MFASFLDDRLTADSARRWATIASLSAAITLVILKLGAYLMTDSLSLLSSLLDSGADVVASLVTYIGVREALKPADHEHRFGHGKAEAMAALGTAAFVTGSALFLVVEALMRLISPREIAASSVGLVVMVISMLITFLLISFQSYVVRRTGSTAIAADEKHYTADFASNAAVIVSLLLVHFTKIPAIDAVFATAVAGWLIWQVVPVARHSVNMLMDHEVADELREKVLAIARSHHAVMGVHDLRTRQSGDDIFIELHLEFDGDMKLRSAHVVGDQIDLAIRQAIRNAEVLVHFDPYGIEESRRDDRIQKPVLTQVEREPPAH